MWLPALVGLAQRNNWALDPITKPGCEAGQITPGANGTCSAWFHWAVAQARSLHPYEAIVAFDGGASSSADASGPMAGLRQAVSGMQSATHRVTLMEDVPQLGIDPTDCLLTHGATMASCTFPLTSAVQRNLRAAADLAAALHANYFPTVDWFCAQGQCPTVVGHYITHTDQGHISRTYVTHLAPALAYDWNTAAR
jgi:hypothetical protein